MKIIDYPIVRQSTTYTCGVACVQAALCYYGINKREGQLLKMTEADRDGVSPDKIVKAIKQFGLKATYKKLTIEDLILFVDKDIPVIVNFQAWSNSDTPDYLTTNKDGHYATVIGYNERRKILIFSDSSSYYKTFLTYSEFESRWHDGNKSDWDYDHMGIVVKGRRHVYRSDKIKRTE